MNGRTLLAIGPGPRSPRFRLHLLRFCRLSFSCVLLSLVISLGLPSDAAAAPGDASSADKAAAQTTGTARKKNTQKPNAGSSASKKSSPVSSRSSAPANSAQATKKRAAPRTKKASQKRKPLYVRSLLPQQERAALLERGIYSGFGPRAVSKKRVRLHKGIDVSAPQGSVITAFNDGKVIFSGRKGDGYGVRVLIEQIDGREALYAHMQQTSVKVGDEVRRGDHIGFVGRTGRATGAHLHFELIDEGENLDPAEHVWLGSELVLGPHDPDPTNTEGRTSFAAKNATINVQ